MFQSLTHRCKARRIFLILHIALQVIVLIRMGLYLSHKPEDIKRCLTRVLLVWKVGITSDLLTSERKALEAVVNNERVWYESTLSWHLYELVFYCSQISFQHFCPGEIDFQYGEHSFIHISWLNLSYACSVVAFMNFLFILILLLKRSHSTCNNSNSNAREIASSSDLQLTDVKP